ncbi:MAG: hypothetical protein IKC50_04925, partial [Oscillospiraceae bacterium]|nr:hypothetical protein [Oscillospiraceae bacterium]
MNKTLHAGFARIDITPVKASVPLAGHGATEYRMSARVELPLNANVIALANGDERCVYFSLDIIGVANETVRCYRDAISEATGLPHDRIFLTASHTHSGPDLKSELPTAVQYRDEYLRDRLVEGAKRALADLKPAKLSYGATLAGRPGAWLNFDRHYYSVEDAKKDNYTKEDLIPSSGKAWVWRQNSGYTPVEYQEEADHSIQLIRFAREDADDIVLVNFAAHSTFADGQYRPCINADFPGEIVKRLEELAPCAKFAYFQGCCGNLIPYTFLAKDGIWGVTYPPRSPIKGMLNRHVSQSAYGAMVAGYAFKALTQCMKPSETDTLAFLQRQHPGTIDHRKDHLVETAQKALEVYNKEGNTPAANEWCAQFGIGGISACNAILRKAKLPATEEIELNAIRIGDCAITTIPFEPFSSIGESIKERSPFGLTFVNGYCCGY